MSIVLDAVLEANRKYAETFGSKSELPIPPGRKFAIVTCMDARLDPAKFAGLAEGDAHHQHRQRDHRRAPQHLLVVIGEPHAGQRDQQQDRRDQWALHMERLPGDRRPRHLGQLTLVPQSTSPGHVPGL